MKNNSKKHLGAVGEAQAWKHYQRRRFKLIQKNWRIPQGEIDLIVQKKDLLVFVEVKTAGLFSDYSPLENVTEEKVNKLNLLIDCFLSYHEKDLTKVRKVRLDAALVWETSEDYRVEIIENISI